LRHGGFHGVLEKIPSCWRSSSRLHGLVLCSSEITKLIQGKLGWHLLPGFFGSLLSLDVGNRNSLIVGLESGEPAIIPCLFVRVAPLVVSKTSSGIIRNRKIGFVGSHTQGKVFLRKKRRRREGIRILTSQGQQSQQSQTTSNHDKYQWQTIEYDCSGMQWSAI
jgi:hypothetical protein